MKKIILQLFKSFSIILLMLLFVQCSEEIEESSHLGTIKGIVVKHETNEPLANVKISTAPTTETIFTGEDGTFIIKDVPMGDYSIKAELKGYLMEINPANLIEMNQVVSVVVEMKDDNALNSPPNVPQLITPYDNAFEVGQTVDLLWTCVDPDGDEIKYKLIVKNNRNDDVVTIEDLSESSYRLVNLSFDTSYFWQIVANDDINEEVYSPVFKFKTAKVPQNRFHFVRQVGNNLNIFSSDEIGNFFQLTQDNVNDLRPRKNVSAGLMAFLRMNEGNLHIYTSNLDGSNAVRVTQNPISGFNNNEIDYSWNAIGSELIYPNYNKLYRVNKDGSGTNLVYTTQDGSYITECVWSNDGSKIVLKTNDIDGYNAKIIMIDIMGNHLKTIVENVSGAMGGLDISVDGNTILFTRDISGFQNNTYRQLNTHIFIYNLITDTFTDVSSLSKIPTGFIDIDPRFSPNEAEIIFTQTSNDGLSRKDIYKISLTADADNGNYSRTLLFENAWMPDWE